MGKSVLCCDKGKCGSHTLVDLEDLIEMTVENGCLRRVRNRRARRTGKTCQKDAGIVAICSSS